MRHFQQRYKLLNLAHLLAQEVYHYLGPFLILMQMILIILIYTLIKMQITLQQRKSFLIMVLEKEQFL